jgi:hypothetical protein
MEYLGLHNKPKSVVHLEHYLTRPVEEAAAAAGGGEGKILDGLRADVDVVDKRKICCLCWRWNPASIVVQSVVESLCCQSCLSSLHVT